MFISLQPVGRFTNVGGKADSNEVTAVTHNAGLSSPSYHTKDIHALRHLRNKITHHTNPVVTIDHGQSAMLALLNGIRSAPTRATPMPAGWKEDTEQTTYDNANSSVGKAGRSDCDGCAVGYDARDWGLAYPNMTLSREDFDSETSEKVKKALGCLYYEQDYPSRVIDGVSEVKKSWEYVVTANKIKEEQEQQRVNDEACGRVTDCPEIATCPEPEPVCKEPKYRVEFNKCPTFKEKPVEVICEQEPPKCNPNKLTRCESNNEEM